MVKNENTMRVEERAILSLSWLVPAGIAERELRALKGVNDVSINHLAHTVQVSYDPTRITSDKIRALLSKLGS